MHLIAFMSVLLKIGRNSFQRPRKEALDFLDEVLNIYLEN